MKDKIEKAIISIRPALQADGGDIEIVSVDEKTGIVSVRLKGACYGCPHSAITLKEGVERVIMEAVPEVKAVIAV